MWSQQGSPIQSYCSLLICGSNKHSRVCRRKKRKEKNKPYQLIQETWEDMNSQVFQEEMPSELMCLSIPKGLAEPWELCDPNYLGRIISGSKNHNSYQRLTFDVFLFVLFYFVFKDVYIKVSQYPNPRKKASFQNALTQ